MLFAAIDIGSNGIRLQIVRVITEGERLSFKKVEYIRFPLRLGKSVFDKGRIAEPSVGKFNSLMHAFKLFMDLYEIDHYIATATSAMREAQNGLEILSLIESSLGLKVEIISGKMEAEILGLAIIPSLDEKTYIHVDVGGGSTELNLYRNRNRIAGKSFNIGTVRKLSEKKRVKVWNELSDWTSNVTDNQDENIIAVGTGGNINKLFKLSNQSHNRSISFKELRGLSAYVSQFDFEDRIKILKMNPDRADVILPAAKIYTGVMSLFKSDHIIVPGVGLKDGLMFKLYNDVMDKQINDVQFVSQF